MYFIYRHETLRSTLAKKRVRAALVRLGYPDVCEGGVAPLLGELRRRFRESEGFPHEIGFFLGYPIEDVWCFMTRREEKCKYCGLWKVYGDVERAKRRFDEYARMKNALSELLKRGKTIADVSARICPYGRTHRQGTADRTNGNSSAHAS
jgi:hypothetical protein